MPGVIEFPRPKPVYVVGDSHAFAFSDRIYAAASGATFLFRSLYCPGLRTREFVSAGSLDSRIVAGLEAMRALVRDGEELQAWHRTTSPHWQWVFELDDRARYEPAIVFTTGSADILDIGDAFDETDFVLPDAVLNGAGVPAICAENLPGALPAAAATALFAAPLEGLRGALRVLRALGFSRLAVLGAPPPTIDEEHVRRTMDAIGHRIPEGHGRLAFVYKTVVMINALLRGICEDEDAHFVERWSAISHDGLVLPEMLRDFVHCTPDAATAAVEDIVAWLGTPVRARVSEHAPALAEIEVVYTATVPAGEPVAALHALVAPRSGTRVLDLGGGAAGKALTADGAEVETAGAATVGGAAGDANGYDAVLAAGVVHDLAPDDAERLIAGLSARLRPAGRLIVHTSPNHGMLRTAQRPATLRRQLRAAFEYVHVWIASANDPGGSLARGIADAEYGQGSDIFAVASHAPIDRAALAGCITMEPLAEIEGSIGLDDLTAPAQAGSGETFAAEVTLINRTTTSLRSFGNTPVLFAYGWGDRGGPAGEDRGRCRLELTSEPGTARRYALQIAAPPRRGPHVLRLTLVQEMVRWFDAEAEIAIDLG